MILLEGLKVKLITRLNNDIILILKTHDAD